MQDLYRQPAAKWPLRRKFREVLETCTSPDGAVVGIGPVDTGQVAATKGQDMLHVFYAADFIDSFAVSPCRISGL